MKIKKIFSWLFLLIGIVFMITGIRMLYRIEQAKKKVHTIDVPFSDKPVGIIVDKSVEDAAGKNDGKAVLLLVVGVALTVTCGLLIRFYKRKQ